MTKEEKVIITISIDKEVFDKIELERGLTNRSTFINWLLRKVLGFEK